MDLWLESFPYLPRSLRIIESLTCKTISGVSNRYQKSNFRFPRNFTHLYTHTLTCFPGIFLISLIKTYILLFPQAKKILTQVLTLFGFSHPTSNPPTNSLITSTVKIYEEFHHSSLLLLRHSSPNHYPVFS